MQLLSYWAAWKFKVWQDLRVQISEMPGRESYFHSAVCGDNEIILARISKSLNETLKYNRRTEEYIVSNAHVTKVFELLHWMCNSSYFYNAVTITILYCTSILYSDMEMNGGRLCRWSEISAGGADLNSDHTKMTRCDDN